MVIQLDLMITISLQATPEPSTQQAKETGLDYLALDYVTDNLPGNEGCQFDAVTAFSGCPGRAGLPNLPNGQPTWGGTLQRFEACNGDNTLIGDSWLGCLSYLSSPYFEIGSPNNSYWVISANDDPSFDQCNEGPPNLSHPVLPYNSPTNNLYKVGMQTILIGSAFKKRMQLEINNSQHDFFCNITNDINFSIPFLSVGAQFERGNSTIIGRLGSDTYGGFSSLGFKMRVKSYVPFDCPTNITPLCQGSSFKGSHAGIYIISTWNNTHHLLFLELLKTGVLSTLTRPDHSLWNWPVKDSFFYPGADIATFSAGTNLQQVCNLDYPELDTSSSNFVDYHIDISALFQCAKNIGYYPDLPNNNVTIEGIHWFAETLGLAGKLSIEIQEINMNLDNLIFRNSFE